MTEPKVIEILGTEYQLLFHKEENDAKLKKPMDISTIQ